MAGSNVEDLIKKRDQLNAKIQAAKTKETQKIRKQQTQAKILLGQALLNRLESKDGKAEELFKWCRESLTDKDKARLDDAMYQQKPQAETLKAAEPASSYSKNPATKETTN